VLRDRRHIAQHGRLTPAEQRGAPLPREITDARRHYRKTLARERETVEGSPAISLNAGHAPLPCSSRGGLADSPRMTSSSDCPGFKRFPRGRRRFSRSLPSLPLPDLILRDRPAGRGRSSSATGPPQSSLPTIFHFCRSSTSFARERGMVATTALSSTPVRMNFSTFLVESLGRVRIDLDRARFPPSWAVSPR